MRAYQPEGACIRTPENQAALCAAGLQSALFSRVTLEAVPTVCDAEHTLQFQFDDCRGILPREEAALTFDSAPVREAAIVSRVGKPTCFQVMAFEDGLAILSRRDAQLDAWEALCDTHRPGDILPAVVTAPASFGAFCDIGCGLTALLPVSRIAVSHTNGGTERFVPGQRIFAVLERIDPDSGRVTLSHRELLGTWEENAALYSAGQTVTGVVRSVRDYGAFIELTPNLSGLAEPDDRLSPGDAVSVYIKSIQPDRCKIKLAIVSLLHQIDLPPQPMRYFQTEGRLDCWQYRPGAPLTLF